jgi:hypothetical protein
MKYLQLSARLALMLALFTCAGQVQWKGENLENRYHRFVNTSRFQSFFWTAATPVTWSIGKLKEVASNIGAARTSSEAQAR